MGELYNITAANATLVLTVDTVIPSGIILSGFSADLMFEQGEVQMAETRMGVDAHLAAGWIPTTKTVRISLEAASLSHTYFEMVVRAQNANRCIYPCTLVGTIPAVRRIYTWTNGVIKSGTPVPSAKKVLDPTYWTLEFADLAVVPY